MAITKEFLTGLGVSEEAAKAIFAERGKEIEESKTKLNEGNGKLEALSQELATLQQKLKSSDSTAESLTALQAELESYKKKVSDYEAEKAAAKQAELDAESDKKLSEKVMALVGDKKFTSEYAKQGLLSDIKRKKAEDNDKDISDIFNELTKDATGIFANPNEPVKLPKGATGDMGQPDIERIRAIMGLPSLNEKK